MTKHLAKSLWLMGFAVAVTTTWLLNRSFTFRGPTHHRSWRQIAVPRRSGPVHREASYRRLRNGPPTQPCRSRMILWGGIGGQS